MNKTNEELACLRMVFSLAAVFDASLWAWLAQNYDTAQIALLIFATIAVCVFAIAVAWSATAMFKRLDRME